MTLPFAIKCLELMGKEVAEVHNDYVMVTGNLPMKTSALINFTLTELAKREDVMERVFYKIGDPVHLSVGFENSIIETEYTATEKIEEAIRQCITAQELMGVDG
jgi:hypothetical protein